ncbi:MAG: hypothetical protein ACK56I_08815, partial [bacterium]
YHLACYARRRHLALCVECEFFLDAHEGIFDPLLGGNARGIRRRCGGRCRTAGHIEQTRARQNIRTRGISGKNFPIDQFRLRFELVGRGFEFLRTRRLGDRNERTGGIIRRSIRHRPGSRSELRRPHRFGRGDIDRLGRSRRIGRQRGRGCRGNAAFLRLLRR